MASTCFFNAPSAGRGDCENCLASGHAHEQAYDVICPSCSALGSGLQMRMSICLQAARRPVPTLSMKAVPTAQEEGASAGMGSTGSRQQDLIRAFSPRKAALFQASTLHRLWQRCLRAPSLFHDARAKYTRVLPLEGSHQPCKHIHAPSPHAS